MKALLFTLTLTLSFHSMAYSVIDSMYESKEVEPVHLLLEREPSSQDGKYCLVDDDSRKFAENCYATSELCQKRLDFWKDLPGVKLSNCAKI